MCHTPWVNHFHREADEVKAGKVNLTNVRWMLPRVTCNEIAKLALMKQIKDQVVLNYGLRI